MVFGRELEEKEGWKEIVRDEIRRIRSEEEEEDSKGLDEHFWDVDFNQEKGWVKNEDEDDEDEWDEIDDDEDDDLDEIDGDQDDDLDEIDEYEEDDWEEINDEDDEEEWIDDEDWEIHDRVGDE